MVRELNLISQIVLPCFLLISFVHYQLQFLIWRLLLKVVYFSYLSQCLVSERNLVMKEVQFYSLTLLSTLGLTLMYLPTLLLTLRSPESGECLPLVFPWLLFLEAMEIQDVQFSPLEMLEN